MSEVVTAAPAPPVVRLPPAVRGPKLFQGLAFVVSRRRLLGRFVRRYGKAFTANILMYGRVVVVADPQLARQVFTSSPEELGNIQPNLSRMFGSGSVFALDGDDHRRRRRLLAPPFHGKSMKNYETIIEEETLRETANWPQGQAFATLPSMMHITLNAILRAIFGAGGSELDELRRLIPPWVRAELAHQVGVPPQVGGADEAAQLHHLLSENDKRLSQSVNTWRGSSTMLEP